MKRIFWPVLVLFLGFFIPFSVFKVAGMVYGGLGAETAASGAVVILNNNFEAPREPEQASSESAGGTESVKIFSAPFPEEGKFIKADLSGMRLRLYEDGGILEEFDILSVGKKGTAWETPVGDYKVETKEDNHFSTIGSVWMPYSVQFFGNFFVHGWPYYPGGSPVPRGFSGGCIRLLTDDAKKVYGFAKPGMPFLVTGDFYGKNETAEGEPRYFFKSNAPFPQISAKAFLVADLDNGVIVKEKRKNEKLPIASITKLMTALVSLEAINQYLQAIVSENAISAYGDAGSLKAGEKITVEDLIYPLLLESSNDAAVVLAEQLGERNFIRLMNEKAFSAGFYGTYFKDSSGLSPENVSTAEDLFRLAKYLFNSKRYILEVTKKKQFELKDGNDKIVHSWFNVSKFTGEKGFLGGKTGYTDEARETAVEIFSLPLSEFSSRNIVIVVLGSENREGDVFAILNWLKQNTYYSEKTVAENDSLKIIFTGDIMPGRAVEKTVAKYGGGDFSFMFKHVGFIKEADIAFGNLEGPVSDKGEDLRNLYSFRFKPEVVSALAGIGFDVLSVANNHIGDWGRNAFEDTLSRLKEKNIIATGAGMDKAEAVQPKIIEKNGVRVGFLAFTDVGPDWLDADENSSGILNADNDFSSIIKNASGKADVLIVSIHFGEEYQNTSTTRQKQLAKAAIDAGAKIVVGHHPHVVQEIEYYKNGIIAYGLGNFVFDQNFSEETMRGLVLEVVLKGKEIAVINQKPIKINNLFQPEPAE